MIYYSDGVECLWINSNTGEHCYYIKEYCPLCKYVTQNLFFPMWSVYAGVTTEKKICTEHSWADDEDRKKANLSYHQNHAPDEEWRKANEQYLSLKLEWLRKYGGHNFVEH